MAASNIQVTQGSGTRLATSSYTEGGQTVHDEKVIHGEQYLPAYTAIGGTVSTATGTSHLLQVMAGSALRVYIRRFQVFQLAGVTTAAVATFTLQRLTTAGTGGTSITPSPLDPADGSSGATSMTLPTAKGTEGVALWAGEAYLIQTVGASTPFNSPILDVDFDMLRTKPPIIAAGTANGVALSNRTAHAGGTVRCVIWFSEASF